MIVEMIVLAHATAYFAAIAWISTIPSGKARAVTPSSEMAG
jgi:hypothetical protein